MKTKVILQEDVLKSILELNASGVSVLKISKMLNVSSSLIYSNLKILGVRLKYGKLTEKEKAWFINNWFTHSAKECSIVLNKSPKCLTHIAAKMGLKGKGQNKYLFQKLNIDPRRFLNIQESCVAYFLGLLWADGTIRIGDRKVGLTMVREDLEVLNLEKYIGKMTEQYYKDKKHPSWKESMKLTFKSRPIYNFLVENDYKEKSLKSPTKILNRIPKSLHNFFFLGFFDGDGCISKSQCTMSIAGSKNQDWKEWEKLCNENNVKYKIRISYNKRGSGSSFIVSGKENLSFFYNYFYRDLVDSPFLKRKYEVWERKYSH